MSQLERQQEILDILNSLDPNRSISVKEIAAKLYSSESSIRRDIIILEKRGLVSHMYGGVMSTQYRNTVMPVSIRDSVNSSSKDKIAFDSASLVKDGDILFLDSSSTARRVLYYLKNRKDLRIITNNLRIFSECENIDAKIYCTGGEFNPKNNNFLGPAAESYIKNINADIMFFSCQGLSENGEINDVSEEEISMRRAMISRSKRQVFLCDSSKIGITKFATLCNIKDISDVICEKPELIEAIKKSAAE